MAFPGLVGSPTTYADNTGTLSSHVVPLPTPLAIGNKVTIAFVSNGTTAYSPPPAENWQLIAGPNATPATYDRVVIYQKDILTSGDAALTSTTFAGLSNQRACAIAVQTDGGRTGYTASEIAVSLIENGAGVAQTTADPPNLSPGWSPAEDVLWMAFGFGHDGNSTLSSYPTNYGLGQTSVQNGGGSGNAVAFAARQLNATSEDPGVFTWNNTKFRSAATLAIRPIAATAVNADLNVTEADDTLSATGGVEIQASLAATEANDVPSATGALQVTASAFITEQDDVGASTGILSISGSVVVTEGNDVPSASGTVDIVGSLAVVEGDDTLSAQGHLDIEASLAITEEDDTLSAQAQMPIVYPRRGGVDEDQEEFERRKRKWKEDLGRVIDRSFRIANGEIDPITFEPIPPPDYTAVIDELKRQALALDHERAAAFVAQQEQLQEEEAIAILLLAA